MINSHIAIVDCAVENQAIQCFNQFVDRYNIPFTYHLPSFLGISSLLNISKNVSAYFILGSYTHIHQKLNWQIELAHFMKDKIEQNIPVIGICFGHQLIAHAFGGSIGPIPGKKELNGYRKVIIQKNKWGLQKDEIFNLVASHKEEIISLPSSFDCIASSNDCKYDLVCHKKYPYLGIQSHPEASLDFIKNSLHKKIEDNELNIIQKDSREIMNKILNYIQTKNKFV